MNNEINLPGWLGGVAALIGALWMIFKHVFSFVTRPELTAAIDNLRTEQQRMNMEARQEHRQMHSENQNAMARMQERLDGLWERRRYPRDEM